MKTSSIWSQSCQIEAQKPLEQDLKTEAAVIGAGMAGILTAYTLSQAGFRTVVLDADRIAGGETRNTTAKITSQHGLIYQRLIRTQGVERAAQYAGANQAAIQAYRSLIDKLHIPCDFEEKDAYLYGSDPRSLMAEAEAAGRLGLPASFVEKVSLPFPTTGAVRFEGQAQFHPLKFIRAISEKLTVFEHTPVRRVDGGFIYTDLGTVKADHIIFACHFPFINFPGLYFARMHQERSYVLALRDAAPIEGMFLGAEPPGYSLRSCGDLLLFGGESHRTGKNQAGGRYDALREKARELFPNSRETACWSAQDCMTADGIPYIGRFSSGKPNWYVATGFQKWGMTSSMVSAMLICDLILGKENPWAEVFDPSRFSAQSLAGICREGGHSAAGLSKQIFYRPAKTAEELPAGHGGVVLLHGKKAGVYKEPDGTIHAVDVRCPHLGCQLEWNPDQLSWDCPCHGSRFDHLGRLISGPAQKSISL